MERQASEQGVGSTAGQARIERQVVHRTRPYSPVSFVTTRSSLCRRATTLRRHTVAKAASADCAHKHRHAHRDISARFLHKPCCIRASTTQTRPHASRQALAMNTRRPGLETLRPAT
eukprot:361858-Chlamydomonas_euryale.AAC.1